MKHRKWLMIALPLVGAFTLGIVSYTYLTGVGQADTSAVVGKGKAAEPLPIRQVVLFNLRTRRVKRVTEQRRGEPSREGGLTDPGRAG